MSLTSILQALEADAGRQVAEIEQATRAEVARIRAQAQAEAAVLRQSLPAAMEVRLRAEQARILNRARLKALQIVQGAREDLIAEAIEAATRRMADLRSTAAYAQVLRQLTLEAFDVLGVSGQMHFQVRSDDIDLMERIAREMGISAEVTGGLGHENDPEGGAGGLVATTADGRISLINTQAVRLGRVGRQYRAWIADLLFNAQTED